MYLVSCLLVELKVLSCEATSKLDVPIPISGTRRSRKAITLSAIVKYEAQREDTDLQTYNKHKILQFDSQPDWSRNHCWSELQDSISLLIRNKILIWYGALLKTLICILLLSAWWCWPQPTSQFLGQHFQTNLTACDKTNLSGNVD